jgi:hypothetical protein
MSLPMIPNEGDGVVGSASRRVYQKVLLKVESVDVLRKSEYLDQDTRNVLLTRRCRSTCMLLPASRSLRSQLKPRPSRR